jgi:PAS domain S-box-containing protein
VATILIIDDQPTNREYLATLLGYADHRLLQASDGAEGLVIAKAARPNLVIADILMPTMDGYEFVRQLRADPAVASTAVIFYTAHYHEREAEDLAHACGVFHVLTKPCEPEVVLRTLQAALDAGPAPPQALARDFDRDHLRLLTDKLSHKADELHRINERLTPLIDLGLDMGSERDPQRLLQSFCQRAREVIGARYAVVGVLDADQCRLRHCITCGMGPETAERLALLGPRQGILGSVLHERRCWRALNPGGDPDRLGLSSAFPRFHSLLAAPIVSPTRAYGWLCLFDKLGADEFSPEDERLASIVAAQVGRIYENGSLYADVLRHAADLEREAAERQRAEQALRESHNLLRTVIESIPEVLYAKDKQGRYLLVNSAAARFMGKPAEDILGRDDLGLFDAETAGRFMEMDRRVIETGKTATYEKPGAAALASHTYLTTKIPFLGPDGEVRGVLGISRDITELKQAEQAREKYAAGLQALSRRLVEVQEEECRHLARELHDEIGQVLATINFHLHAAKSLTGAAAQGQLEECTTLLQQAGEQVRSLALELRPTVLDSLGLEATLRWLAERHCQRTGSAAQVVGHLSGTTPSPEIAIACFRVAQEALTNVVRHAAAQNVWIELSQSESVLELVVRDDGVGFDVARTQEQAAKRGRLGLLGMAERVQLLGGRLQVESEPGRGTRIRALFPLEDGEGPTEEEE